MPRERRMREAATGTAPGGFRSTVSSPSARCYLLRAGELGERPGAVRSAGDRSCFSSGAATRDRLFFGDFLLAKVATRSPCALATFVHPVQHPKVTCPGSTTQK